MVSGVLAFRKTDPDGDCRASLARADQGTTDKPCGRLAGGLGQACVAFGSRSLRPVRFFDCDKAAGGLPGAEALLLYGDQPARTGPDPSRAFPQPAGVQAHRARDGAHLSSRNSPNLVWPCGVEQANLAGQTSNASWQFVLFRTEPHDFHAF